MDESISEDVSSDSFEDEDSSLDESISEDISSDSIEDEDSSLEDSSSKEDSSSQGGIELPEDRFD